MVAREFSSLAVLLLTALGVVCWADLGSATITNVDSSSFTWDGFEGPYGGTVPDNSALPAHGGTPFAIDELIPGGVHTIAHLNDGVYGNSNSWIGLTGRAIDLGGAWGSVNTGFAGIAWPSAVSITSFTFGRSALDEYRDRCAGTYYIQVTSVGTVDKDTIDANWTTIGSIVNDGGSTRSHTFNMTSPVSATGLRIVVPGVGWSGAGTCIDEIEVNKPFVPPPPPVTVATGSLFTYTDYVGKNLMTVPASPADIALSSAGATAFASDCIAGYSEHTIAHLNDGTYGNPNSWIGIATRDLDLHDYGVFNGTVAGVALAGPSTITGFSLGRDNLAAYKDRNTGPFYVQYSTEASNVTDTTATYDAQWTTIGSFSAFEPNDAYDHQFTLESPIVGVTGLRIVTGSQNCIDEIAVYGSLPFLPSATWVGGDSSTSYAWSKELNWSPAGGLQTNAALAFPAGVPAASLTNTNDVVGYSCRGMTFEAGADAYALKDGTGGSAVTLTGDVVNNSTALQTINLPLTLVGARTFDAAAGDITVTGAIGGGGASLAKTGAGKLILGGACSYTGDTIINQGTLEFETGGSLSGALIVNAEGTLILDADRAFGNLGGTGGTIQITGGHTFTTNMVADTTFGGTITGAGNFVRAGGGWSPLRLAALQSYTGSTTITGAYLVLVPGTGANLPTGTLLDIHADGIFDIGEHATEISGLTSGPIEDATGVIYSWPGTTAATLTINMPSGSQTYAGNIGGGFPNISIVKDGAGTQVFSGANNYAGATEVKGGTLQVRKPASLPGYDAANRVFVRAGATLALNVGTAEEWDGATLLTLGANATFDAGAFLGIDTTDVPGGTLSYPDNITGGPGLAKLGTGTLSLGGINSFESTAVRGGTLEITNPAGLPAGRAVSIAEGATLVLVSGLSAAGAGRAGAAPVPEPGTIVLLAAGGVALLAAARRKRRIE